MTHLLLAALLAAPPTPTRIEAFAGTGDPGFAGDGGRATAARLNQPFHCDLDGKGHLYVADMANHRVRKIDLKTGTITTVAGTGEKGSAGDGAAATRAQLNEPYAVAADGLTGNLYVVERFGGVRKIDGKTGTISNLLGKPTLREPNDCCLDGTGGLLVADVADWRIRRIDLKTGAVTTFAGTGKPKGKRPDRTRIGDGGPATAAVIVGARAVCVDGQGNTYICEREGNAVRKVGAKGVITTVAGTGASGYNGDGGPATAATFRSPKGVRCDGQGNVYVVDADNHAIRRIDAKTGVVTTVAGGRQGMAGDGGPAVKAGLDKPHGCVLGEDGTLYIADSGNNRVRRVAGP